MAGAFPYVYKGVPVTSWGDIEADVAEHLRVVQEAKKLEGHSEPLAFLLHSPETLSAVNALTASGVASPGAALGKWISRNWGPQDWARLDHYRDGVREPAFYLWRMSDKVSSKERAYSPDDEQKASGYAFSLVVNLKRYTEEVNRFLAAAGDERFVYEGFNVRNPERLPTHVSVTLLDGVSYVVSLFKKRGVFPLLQESVKSILIREPVKGEKALGWYNTQKKRVEILAHARVTQNPRMLRTWVQEVFLHEVGHHIHLSLLHPEAKEWWDSGWAPVKEVHKEQQDQKDQWDLKVRAVTHAERVHFWDLLVAVKGDLKKIRLKGLPRMKFHAWLANPMLNKAFVTPKNLRWTARGVWLSLLLEGDLEALSLSEEARRLRLKTEHEALAVTDDWASQIHPSLSEEQVAEYRQDDTSLDEALSALQVKIERAIDPLQPVTDYARTNEKEDFAEAFVAFMDAPGALTPSAKYRIQKALSMSGLYGKSILKIANEDVAKDRDQMKLSRSVEDMSGIRTLVKTPNPSKSDTDKPQGESGKYPTQGLPRPDGKGRSKPSPTPVFNGPGESGSNSDGTVHEDMVRTKGVPGEQATHPVTPARVGPTRRPGMTASLDEVIEEIAREAGMYAPAYPTGQTRHHKQRGEASLYDRKRYKKQRGKIIQRQKRRHKKLKADPRYVRDRERRKKEPERFTTKPSGGSISIKQRNKDRKKTASFTPVPFLHYGTGEWGTLTEVTPFGMAVYDIGGVPHREKLDRFLDDAVIDEDRLDDLLTYLDELFEYEGGDEDSEEGDDPRFDAWQGSLVNKLAGAVLADFLREQRPPDMADDTKYDRADNHGEWQRRDRERLEDNSEYTGINDGNPGSKVLPSGAGHVEKQAALMKDIRGGCDPRLVREGAGLVGSVRLRRVDAQKALWAFEVKGSKPYQIRLQAIRQGNVASLAKAHLRVSCSCPFWQFQGPEHWAKQGDYLYGKPTGTATKPSTRDPQGRHLACKHVIAVLDFVSARKWDIPQQKTGSLLVLAHILASQDAVGRVVARYLESKVVSDT